jgi:hypothetical protein
MYIHIPKNSGKYLRKLIIDNPKNKILKEFWDINNNLDLAHIPYMLYKNYYECNIDFIYTYVRDPYDRIISGFKYKNPNKNTDDFKTFVKTELPLFDFNFNFNSKYIHYYPQYLFICDKNTNINNVHIKKLETEPEFFNDKSEKVEPEFFNNKKLKPKKYDLIKYIDNECLRILNFIYKEDFLKFNYTMINNVDDILN